jgi:hypothetical protein
MHFARVSPAGAVSRVLDIATTGHDGREVPIIDIAPDGEAVVIFNEIDSVSGAITGVRLIRVGADNSITADRTLTSIGQIPWGNGQQVLDVAADGTANILGLTVSGDPVRPTVTSIQLVRVPRTGNEQATELDLNRTANTSAVRVLSSGETVAAWEPFDPPTLTLSAVRARHVSAAGIAGPVIPASPNGYRVQSALGIGGDGAVIATIAAGSTGDVVSVSRMAADGVVGSPFQLSSGGALSFVNANNAGAGCATAAASSSGGTRVVAVSASGAFGLAYADPGSYAYGPFSVLAQNDSSGTEVHSAVQSIGHGGIVANHIAPDGSLLANTDLASAAAAASGNFSVSASDQALGEAGDGTMTAAWVRWDNADQLSSLPSVWLARTGAVTSSLPPAEPGASTPGNPAPGTPPGTSPSDPLCSGAASVFCLTYPTYPTYPTSPVPCSPRKACDPGADTGSINIAGTTFACIFTGDIWDDPTLISGRRSGGVGVIGRIPSWRTESCVCARRGGSSDCGGGWRACA